MERAFCPACASASIAARVCVPDHEYGLTHVATYARCGGCGSLYQQPMPEIGELAAYYPSNYHSFTASGVIPRLKHRARLKRLTSFVNTSRPVVLDYGCGDGGFIRDAAARAAGWQFWGYEIASRSEKILKEDGRVTIIRGSLDDLLSELPPCDLVTMNHVIEHLPDPVSVLTALRQRMPGGAVLEGQTPAADSFECRVFGTAWSGFHAPRHTVVFSRPGLTAAIERAHFIAPQVTTAFNPAGIAVSLASALHGRQRGKVRRTGGAWLGYLAAATVLQPIDRLSGCPGIVNYVAYTPPASSGAQA
jgi:SAM-dependent methyltransferase